MGQIQVSLNESKRFLDVLQQLQQEVWKHIRLVWATKSCHCYTIWCLVRGLQQNLQYCYLVLTFRTNINRWNLSSYTKNHQDPSQSPHTGFINAVTVHVTITFPI